MIELPVLFEEPIRRREIQLRAQSIQRRGVPKEMLGGELGRLPLQVVHPPLVGDERQPRRWSVALGSHHRKREQLDVRKLERFRDGGDEQLREEVDHHVEVGRDLGEEIVFALVQHHLVPDVLTDAVDVVRALPLEVQVGVVVRVALEADPEVAGHLRLLGRPADADVVPGELELPRHQHHRQEIAARSVA